MNNEPETVATEEEDAPMSMEFMVLGETLGRANGWDILNDALDIVFYGVEVSDRAIMPELFDDVEVNYGAGTISRWNSGGEDLESAWTTNIRDYMDLLDLRREEAKIPKPTGPISDK